MKLKYFALLPLFFTFSFIFSQSDKHNPWIIELGESVTNPLTNQRKLLSLLEDASQLDEVLLIGYGTVKKEDLTGAADLITSW